MAVIFSIIGSYFATAHYEQSRMESPFFLFLIKHILPLNSSARELLSVNFFLTFSFVLVLKQNVNLIKNLFLTDQFRLIIKFQVT